MARPGTGAFLWRRSGRAANLLSSYFPGPQVSRGRARPAFPETEAVAPMAHPEPTPPSPRKPVLPSVRAAFRAIASTVVPEAERLGEAEWAEVETIVERALAERPPSVRRQVGLFLRLLDAAPLLRWGRRLRALGPGRRTLFLRRVERSRSALLRRGFWGLRTLVFMGYYARPAATQEIGYAARPSGWRDVGAASRHEADRVGTEPGWKARG